MLFLLRKIRRKLMESKKITSYLLYAVGEIFLVVIGILIAVQINNWNSNRINQIQIHTAVEFMLEELKSDSIERQLALETVAPLNEDIQRWQDRINGKDATFDTVKNIMRNEFNGTWITHFRENTTTYENMKSTGVLDLMPDTIRLAIDEYYKSMNRTIKIVDMYNVQYREPLEEYNRTYSIFLNSDNLIDQAIWSDIDPKHFLPRARWLVFTKLILWKQYEKFCQTDQQRLINLRAILRSYQNQFE